ncbi:hypothetical protein ACFRFU_19630 [Streptomyces sp. NPDC056704]|uniref:DUF6197 family protein n=1 Tax=Streptomyces sp. NPDC056704 TaxID=3345917 RepID=UPI003679E2E1
MIAPTAVATAAAPVELDLDARLAMVGAVMDGRLALANIAFEVDTAHIPAAEPIPDVTAPLPLTPTLAPSPYSTPIAGLLHRARNRIVVDGWCRDALYDDQGAICPIRAIRLEAASRYEADDACVLLLESIQRTFQAETIPSWNAQQTSVGTVLIAFDRAADLAHARNL